MLFDFARGLFRSAREYLNPRRRLDFILINDAGLFYFSYCGKTASRPVYVTRREYDNLTEGLIFISRKIKESPFYHGRPVTVVIGGSLVFSEISLKLSNAGGGRDFVYSEANDSNFQSAFRLIEFNQGTTAFFHSGIRPETKSAVYNTLAEAGIPMLDCLPVAYYLIKSLAGALSGGVNAFMLPGQIIWIGIQKKLHLYEQPCAYPDTSGFVPDNIAAGLCREQAVVKYHSLRAKDGSEKKHGGTLPLSLSPGGFLSRGTKSFWGSIPGENRTKILNILERPVRMAALWATTMALVLGGVGVLISSWSAGFDREIARDDTLRTRLIVLEDEISHLENQIGTWGNSLAPHDCLAASISVFCQKKPTGLYLDKIEFRKDKGGSAILIAYGLAADEDEIFLYKGDIESENRQVKFEIKNMERLQPKSVAVTGTQPRYTFAITLVR